MSWHPFYEGDDNLLVLGKQRDFELFLPHRTLRYLEAWRVRGLGCGLENIRGAATYREI